MGSRLPNNSNLMLKIIWLTQGGFLFENRGYRIVVDPYMSDSLAAKGVTRLAPFPLSLEDLRPDAVLCTHDHLDHLDPETITWIAGTYPSCVFTGPERAFQHLDRLGVSRSPLPEPGHPLQLGPFEILPVFARHSDPTAVGFVIRADGRKIYLSGDTEYDERLFSPWTAESDLLLICINGRLGNMTWEQALESALRLKPKTALPMHYGLFAENTADPEPFVSGCRAAGISSFTMKPGEEFAL